MMWSASASCFIAAGRRRPCVSEIMPIRIQMPQSGLGELQNELILWLQRVRRVLIPGIIRIAQEISLLEHLEPRGLDLPPEKRFFDTMQGAGCGDAGTGPARMIGDHIQTAGLECAKDGLVHCRPVHPEMPEVVIV